MFLLLTQTGKTFTNGSASTMGAATCIRIRDKNGQNSAHMSSIPDRSLALDTAQQLGEM